MLQPRDRYSVSYCITANQTGIYFSELPQWLQIRRYRQIIGKVAQKSDQWSQPKQNSRQQKKQRMTQNNIGEMFRSLRAPTDAESASGCDASSESVYICTY